MVEDGALDWEPRELELLVAHEIGHYRRGHVWWLLLESFVVIAIGMWIVDKTLGYALERWPRLGVESLAVPASLPLIIIVFSTWSLLITPAVAGFARAKEHAADAYAVDIVGDASVLELHARREAERLGEPEEVPVE